MSDKNMEGPSSEGSSTTSANRNGKRTDSAPGGRVDRDAVIVRASTVGIASNVALAAVKAIIGLLANSIAIVLDAVNNLSDAMSSIITIVGAKLANKQPDRDHPFGHGRAEYLSTIIIGLIVAFAGIASLKESVEQIITPQTASYDALSLIIVAIAVAVKIVLGRYTTAQGKKAQSDSLVASGTDALLDAVISAATLVAALIFIFTGVGLEAWLAAIISLIIIKAGVDILRDAISKLLGQRVDADVAEQVKKTVSTFDEVVDAVDLTLTDYGPNRLMGAIHVEVDQNMTAHDIDVLSRRIQRAAIRDCGVMLHTVGVHGVDASGSDESPEGIIRRKVEGIVSAHEHVKNIHGFYVNPTDKYMIFDIIIDFDCADRNALRLKIRDEVKQALPDYNVHITLDADISD